MYLESRLISSPSHGHLLRLTSSMTILQGGSTEFYCGNWSIQYDFLIDVIVNIEISLSNSIQITSWCVIFAMESNFCRLQINQKTDPVGSWLYRTLIAILLPAAPRWMWHDKFWSVAKWSSSIHMTVMTCADSTATGSLRERAASSINVRLQ